MKNLEIARIFYEIADILELQGVEFKPRAYRRAARAIEELSEDIEEVYKRGELQDIPGVGERLAKKIEEIIKTGKLGMHEKLKKSFPVDLEGLGKVEGLGPKKAMKLYKALGIRNLDDLEKALKAHKIRDLEGFGEKSEEKMLAGLELAKTSAIRMPLYQAIPIAHEIEGKLRSLPEVQKLEIVGSYRRKKETIGDIDILAVSSNPGKVMDFFTSMYPDSTIIAKGPSKSAIRLSSSLHVDIRVFEESAFGSAMMYFTGSKDHNIQVRRLAQSKGWKLNEYGLFSGKKRIAGKTEEEVFKKLGMEWVPPELRENMGEVEAAQERKLPTLVEAKDIRGDLHTHTNWSEGRNSLEEMAEMAKSLGYEYLLISDHGGSTLKIARSMDGKKLIRQMQEIDKLNKKLDGITLLKGVETNIMEDGSIDLPGSVLRELDIAIASVHSRFSDPKEKMTKRIISAMENEHVDIIGHPTGRVIGSRAPFELDFEEIVDAAKRTGAFLEINSYPERLDLDYLHVFSARGRLRFPMGTDAHEKGQMRFMEIGVSQARKGWCEKKDILNTLPLKGLARVFGF